MKNSFSRTANGCTNACVLGLMMVLGAQISASAQGPLAPMPIPTRPSPGGSTFAEQCVNMWDTIEDVDVCVTSLCVNLHPDDEAKYDACLDNAAAWLDEHVIIEDTEEGGGVVPV